MSSRSGFAKQRLFNRLLVSRCKAGSPERGFVDAPANRRSGSYSASKTSKVTLQGGTVTRSSAPSKGNCSTLTRGGSSGSL